VSFNFKFFCLITCFKSSFDILEFGYGIVTKALYNSEFHVNFML